MSNPTPVWFLSGQELKKHYLVVFKPLDGPLLSGAVNPTGYIGKDRVERTFES
jgi:hypothetical protein